MSNSTNTQFHMTPQGPIFESGPGWGKRINKWTTHHPFESIVIFLLILILAIILFRSTEDSKTQIIHVNKQGNTSITPSSSSPLKTPVLQYTTTTSNTYPVLSNLNYISITIIPRDSYILIARRAITEYISQTPEKESQGQRVYTETTLYTNFQDKPLTPGSTIDVPKKSIQELLDKFTKLNLGQQNTWEKNAYYVNF